MRIQPKPIRAMLILALLGVAAPELHALTWRWSNPLPHGNNIVDMTWNGSSSVQVTELGQLYTGQDFYGWMPQNSGTTNTLQAVKFFGNRIVFVGANGTVGYSDDGVNFTATTLSTPDVPADWLVDLAVSPSLLVAVGDNAVIYTSTDGASWHYQGKAPNNPNGYWLLSAAWGGGTFVVTGEGGYVATSSDGATWMPRASGVSGDLTRVTAVASANSAGVFPYAGFWAVTADGQAIYSTNNGASWRPFTLAASTNVLYALAANPATGLVAGDSALRLGTGPATWPNQTSFLQTPAPAPVWTYYTALWDDTNAAYRVAGDDGMMIESSTTTNGLYLWQLQYPGPRDFLWQITLANDLYIAVGDNTRIMTSQNGVDWSVEAIPLTNSVPGPATNTVFLGVGGGTNLILAVGNRGSVAVSPNTFVPVIITNLDGTTFTNLASTLGVVWFPLPAPTTNDLAAACSFDNAYLLGGGGGTLLRSADGTNWTTLTVPTTNYISGLAPSTNLLVATGDQGLILTSSDGLAWTKRPSGTTNWLFRVRWLNGSFVAVGENGMLLRSTNGLNWSAAVTGAASWLNDAVMVSNTCYVVGNNGVVLASTNFINWSNVPTITGLSLYGAASQNGQLVVVGLEGTLLRSPVIPNLTPPTFVNYTQSAGENIFLLAGVPDQQFTLDSSTNLVTWTTGPLLDLIYGSGTLTFITPTGTNPAPAQFYRATLVP